MAALCYPGTIKRCSFKWLHYSILFQGDIFLFLVVLNLWIKELHHSTFQCNTSKQGSHSWEVVRAQDWVGVIQKEYLPLSHKCDHFDVSCIQILGWNTAEQKIRIVLLLPWNNFHWSLFKLLFSDHGVSKTDHLIFHFSGLIWANP